MAIDQSSFPCDKRYEFSSGQKNPPRCARRKAWPSRAWARVRGIFPRPGEAVLLPLNEKRLGSVHPSGRVFLTCALSSHPKTHTKKERKESHAWISQVSGQLFFLSSLPPLKCEPSDSDGAMPCVHRGANDQVNMGRRF